MPHRTVIPLFPATREQSESFPRYCQEAEDAFNASNERHCFRILQFPSQQHLEKYSTAYRVWRAARKKTQYRAFCQSHHLVLEPHDNELWLITQDPSIKAEQANEHQRKKWNFITTKG